MQKRTANILLAVLGVVIVVIVMLVAGGAWFVMSVFHRQPANATTAGAAFDAARARFKGAGPVFELRQGNAALTRPVPVSDASTQLRTLHVIVWNPREETLTGVDVPLALLRWNDDPIDVLQFAEAAPEVNRRQKVVSITIGELDRFGSSLLVDQELNDGRSLLVWTE